MFCEDFISICIYTLFSYLFVFFLKKIILILMKSRISIILFMGQNFGFIFKN